MWSYVVLCGGPMWSYVVLCGDQYDRKKIGTVRRTCMHMHSGQVLKRLTNNENTRVRMPDGAISH